MSFECPRCEKTKKWYADRFEREYNEARSEFIRLGQLFKDVAWYNFETVATSWQGPWRQTDPWSWVVLNGQRFKQVWNKGVLHEHGRFPIYYSGPVKDAPSLPPLIVLNELKAAKEYMQLCKSRMNDPYDYAPGGAAYERLRASTMVGRKRKHSDDDYDGDMDVGSG